MGIGACLQLRRVLARNAAAIAVGLSSQQLTPGLQKPLVAKRAASHPNPLWRFSTYTYVAICNIILLSISKSRDLKS